MLKYFNIRLIKFKYIFKNNIRFMLAIIIIKKIIIILCVVYGKVKNIFTY